MAPLDPSPLIRPERDADASAIHAVHAAAFPTEDEAALVAALRRRGRLVISLVAEIASSEPAIVGHVAFSRVTIEGVAPPLALPETPAPLALGPIAVLPPWQRRGIGSALIRSGLSRCVAAQVPFVVVLGDPAYYGRFGFAPAHRAGLANEFGAGDAFMVIETSPGGLPSAGGPVRYEPEFAELPP